MNDVDVSKKLQRLKQLNRYLFDYVERQAVELHFLGHFVQIHAQQVKYDAHMAKVAKKGQDFYLIVSAQSMTDFINFYYLCGFFLTDRVFLNAREFSTPFDISPSMSGSS
jgi:hypothetical protein